MGVIRLRGKPEIEIAFRRSARARRLSLRVSALDGKVTLTAPARLPEAEARAFAEEQRGWILTAQDGTPEVRRVADLDSLPVEGRPRLIRLSRVRGAVLDGDQLILPETRPGTAAGAFLKVLARDRLAEATHRHADALGVQVSALALRDTRSRWGSCTARGKLMFSWRLAMAPGDVLDYVAAHEVAHLRHMDHSPAFWGVVETLRPDWRTARGWLRREGASLHAIRFED